ncbi:unnamed protein product [Brassicogethes aeneus]|uniref:Replication factor C subunit 3 n=1 Tax=Brassicogethes aeneus TaxID=1431903 RepID=A0A9P0AWG8_BRAAE|nr:unnamed protein product [Brassicogethes aeneus]
MPSNLLWADKYRPKDLSLLDYHKEQATDLKNLTQDGDFPHLLVYGPLGAGKKTRIMCLLREMFGPGVEKLKEETMSFTTPSNKKLEILALSSMYHIEINPSDVGHNDRVVIMDVIKNVAQTHQLNMSSQKDFKVIVLTDVDDLSKDAQHALRRTMEKYVANCRIILCATSISRVIPAIRSRCLCVRVPAPTEGEVIKILKNVASIENVNLTDELAKEIAVKSERNLRRALLMAEASFVNNIRQGIPKPDWEIFIQKTANVILKEQSMQSLASVRNNLYELIVNGIPSEIIFKVLLEDLLKPCDSSVGANIVEEAATYQYRSVQGNKEIFHLEAFVAKFMCHYSGLVQQMMEFF